MRIPAKKKLEWFREMNEFVEKYSILPAKERKRARQRPK